VCGNCIHCSPVGHGEGFDPDINIIELVRDREVHEHKLVIEAMN
jgi:hypothetical protein